MLYVRAVRAVRTATQFTNAQASVRAVRTAQASVRAVHTVHYRRWIHYITHALEASGAHRWPNSFNVHGCHTSSI